MSCQAEMDVTCHIHLNVISLLFQRLTVRVICIKAFLVSCIIHC